MRLLVTGASGFVGRHLCTHLLESPGADVIGVVGSRPADVLQPHPRLRVIQIDLCDARRTRALIEDVRPDHIFHLAARSSVPASFASPWATIENNVRAQVSLLEAIRELRPAARVLVVGSNEEYGPPMAGSLPLSEESPLRPASPYAVSKVTQDLLGLQYYLAHGLPIIRARPFNHTGPGQSERFVVPAFARQIAMIEAGTQEPVIHVGNLNAGRDFSDVRDIVQGYRMVLDSGVPGEAYNLASGRSQPIRGLLETLVSLSRVPVRVAVDSARFRPVDVPVVFGSADKIRRATGWEPRVPFEQTLRDTLDYWRLRVAA